MADVLITFQCNIYFSLSETPWRKLNTAPVCFGAKGDRFGSFWVEVGGSVEAVKLVHVSGQVSCMPGDWTNWGCSHVDLIVTVITNSSNFVLLPESRQNVYRIPGYNYDSKELVFTGLQSPLSVSSAQELRIWYGSDLIGDTEYDNNGTTCADVYAMHILKGTTNTVWGSCKYLFCCQ